MHPNGACHSVRAVCVMWLLHASVLLLPVAIRGHGSYGSEGSSKESVPSGAKYDNHLNTSQAFQPSELTGGYDSAELTADYGHGDGPDSPFNHHQFRCQACQYRNVYAMASLKSIKAHVLLKLGIEDLPNRTRYPEVPRHILDHFYNSQSYRSPDPDYLGDDPSSLQAEEPEEAEEDYDYYQITNKIYILPNQNISNKERRLTNKERNKEYLQFQLESRDYTGDIYARMMVYVHGDDWWKKNGGRPVAGGATLASPSEVTFSIAKMAKGGGPEIARFQGPIPKGDGRFVEFNVTDMVLQWFKEARDQAADQRTNKYVVLETFNDLSRRLVVHNPNGGQFTPYIEIEFRDAPKKRIKRNLSLNCDQNANETRCCRYPLTVDFEKFGWDWIIAPKRYEASYCAGECMLSFLPKYEHTHVMQLSTSAIPCCSPKKMKSIKLLYFDMSYNVIYSIIPNMVVEECSCS